MNHAAVGLLIGILVSAASHAQTNKLPPANRTVYKCEAGGKVTYSDEPCHGAKKVDVEPTRGLNKATGTERVGTDVARERRRESLSEALKPITGMTPEQFDVHSRRARLEAGAKSECAVLDRELPALERQESSSSGEARDSVQRKLLVSRKRYKELQC